jgi:hypothetical protein
MPHLLGGRERPAGVSQVHIVERRARERRRGDPHARRLERGEDRRERTRALVRASTEDATVERGLANAADGSERGERGPIRVRELDDESVAAQLALQLVRRPGGDDAAAIGDREPGGEPVGLLEGSGSSAGR